MLLNPRFSSPFLLPSLCFNREFSFVLSNSKPDLILKWNSSWMRLWRIWCLYPQHTGSGIEQLISLYCQISYFFFTTSLLTKFINWWYPYLQWKIFTDFVGNLIFFVKFCWLVSIDPDTCGVPFKHLKLDFGKMGVYYFVIHSWKA